LTGNAIRDEQIADDLAREIRNQVSTTTSNTSARAVQTLSSCSPGGYTLGSSANFPQGYTVFGEINYYRQSTCATTNMVDHARIDRTDRASYTAWAWSKVNGSQSTRNIMLGTSWSTWQNLPNGASGQKWEQKHFSPTVMATVSVYLSANLI